MITKETAREIYNCYQQIEEIDKIKSDMVSEIEKAREKEKKEDGPIPENGGSFGKYGKGMQLGIPDGGFSSMRIFSISPTIGSMVMDEQKSNLEKKVERVRDYCKIRDEQTYLRIYEQIQIKKIHFTTRFKGKIHLFWIKRM